jgi:hypothetical protein
MPMRPVAPGRYRAELAAGPPGLHHYAASVGAERASLTVARRAPRELDATGVASDWADWIAAGWVRPYAATALAASARESSARADGTGEFRRATLAALALFLLGVLLERRRELVTAWQGLRARADALADAAQRAWASTSRRP